MIADDVSEIVSPLEDVVGIRIGSADADVAVAANGDVGGSVEQIAGQDFGDVDPGASRTRSSRQRLPASGE